ncbi:MAG TPA: hypothetical protein VF522_19145 [Ramlibacter sp.]|uniref:hypothetical protein n=1 Tax=Ramlibacter sp. TaxID=1917967 RepID=UPI002ED39177
MGVKQIIPGKTGNIAMPIMQTDIARVARRNMIAEFDMLTYDGGNPKLLLDQSGNGFNATFLNNPTVGATGVTFDTINYADFDLTTDLVDDYAFTCVVKTTTSGRYIFGNHNSADGKGRSFNAFSGGAQVDLRGHATSLHAYCAFPGSTVWMALHARCLDRTMFMRDLVTKPYLGQWGTLQSTQTSGRLRWRIGAGATTVGGDSNVSEVPLSNTGTIAYCAVFKKATDVAQEQALLKYLHDRLTARGITLIA